MDKKSSEKWRERERKKKEHWNVCIMNSSYASSDKTFMHRVFSFSVFSFTQLVRCSLRWVELRQNDNNNKNNLPVFHLILPFITIWCLNSLPKRIYDLLLIQQNHLTIFVRLGLKPKPRKPPTLWLMKFNRFSHNSFCVELNNNVYMLETPTISRWDENAIWREKRKKNNNISEQTSWKTKWKNESEKNFWHWHYSWIHSKKKKKKKLTSSISILVRFCLMLHVMCTVYGASWANRVLIAPCSFQHHLW